MRPDSASKPRVGIPWRTSQEEAENNRSKIKNYEDAIRRAGGEPILVPLTQPAELPGLLRSLGAFVLPGSPADVEPAKYGARNRGKSEPADRPREETDRAILKHAFAEQKPVLAICYGCQLLNVYLGGTLVQDLRSETGTKVAHSKKDLDPQGEKDPVHGAIFDPASRLAKIAGNSQAEINSSHHQAVDKAGQNLCVTAHAPDGTIEGVEWTGDANWVLGVQWHPERMLGDRFSERLFDHFIAAARTSRAAVALKI
ncbi:MAG TPA: gamma-glutamyl-gamma-aminobutyrate hydrolase family protein [Candidatus Dormibacteraeota bacterium]|nr:gamma-glutamyl-gamma-aminobutyrate hydrolase family protein [Candidatus Dormibacteraeota bacterium]